ncbi:MAG: 16S rRNA (cytidine(1402)-2'-O)-methyltransferase [Sphingobacteriales bacterium]|nr:16S rRNA (cytidine(1402)-2'-O)-methyltransferase [Sphingobacteriales bacterium]
MLHIVPTPVGNLADITLRALDTLRRADLILAEDTRTTAKLLQHYQIAVPTASFHAHNEHAALAKYIEQLKSGKHIALVSDAGTPAISDPGFLLVRAAVQADIAVECLPGATAFVPALVASALPCDRFIFEGFLPHKKGRKSRWLQLKEEERTLVFYESPFRLTHLLEEVTIFCGDERPVAVARELSKLHEEIKRGTAAEVLEYFRQKGVKGEIVVVVGGKSSEA